MSEGFSERTLAPAAALDDRVRRSIRAFTAFVPLVLIALTVAEARSPEPPTLHVYVQRGIYGALSLALAWRLREGVPARTVLLSATALGVVSLTNNLIFVATESGALSPRVPFFAIGLVAIAFVLLYPPWICALFYTTALAVFSAICLHFTPDTAAPDTIGHAIRLALLGSVAGFFGGAILRNMTQQILDNQRVLRQEAEEAMLARERSRIARDLHDHVGARLTGIALLAEREQKTLPKEAQEPLQLIHQTIRLCLEEIRDVVWALSYARREMPEVLATLRRRAEDLAEAAGLELTLSLDATALPKALDASTSLALLAIVREALTNVVKHSGATRVSIGLAKTDGHLRLEVTDNGHGIIDGASAGRGLNNMKARATEQQGTFAVEKTASGGVSVFVTLPA
ncbi:MAG: sensor histidine kinase [Deltaproteobacteria bacterium]|nr:sensor histidine kinase [Deltaproteobacteria bacterium]